jgi:hypothetical protein
MDRNGRNLIMGGITFYCGARRKETFLSDDNAVRVEFLGRNCAWIKSEFLMAISIEE